MVINHNNFFIAQYNQANSITCYVSPNGIVDGRRVIPDMIVDTAIDDKIAGSDPMLDCTLNLIRDGQ